MKSFLLFLALAGSVLLGIKPNDTPAKKSIEFVNGTWEEIMAKATQENRVVFVDVYATWCGPCKLLRKTTLSNQEVGDFFNANFINVALDGETPEGRKFMEHFRIHSYPTMLFLSANGTPKGVAVGYHTANQLLKVAKSIVN